MTPPLHSPRAGSGVVSVAEAEASIRDALRPAEIVVRPLADAAGDILREPIVADRPFPPYDRVAMDGIALCWQRWRDGVRVFPVQGIQPAGAPAMELGDPVHCIEVMTGAVLPSGCDCVVPVERIRIADGAAHLVDVGDLAPRQFVHGRGSDREVGEVLVREGTALWAPQCAMAASVGMAHVRVSRRPRIALVSTGDEVVGVEDAPEPFQIRSSNPAAARASLARAGFHDVGIAHARDDVPELEETLTQVLAGSQAVVLFGGVSAGRYDHVPDVLEGLGVRRCFHGVLQRPGRPLWFGVGPDGQWVFGLPGNPNSTLVCLHRYVLPALMARMGVGPRPAGCPHATLARQVRFEPPLTLFQPVRIEHVPNGTCQAEPVSVGGSGDAAGFAESDGMLELPADETTFEAGRSFPMWRWDQPEAGRFAEVSGAVRVPVQEAAT